MTGDEQRFPGAVVDGAWRDGRLVFQVGPGGEALWPPRLAATSDQLAWRESAGLGTVYAATALHARDAEPRSVVIVELDEGFRMMSRVDRLPATHVAIGTRVRVRFTEPDADGMRLPVFEPAGDAPGDPAR